nr:probable disease resistance protein At4g27220 [Ipomoea batatas]
MRGKSDALTRQPVADSSGSIHSPLDEAWELFAQRVGKEVGHHYEKETDFTMENALAALEKSEPNSIVMVLKRCIKKLKWSYDSLARRAIEIIVLLFFCLFRSTMKFDIMVHFVFYKVKSLKLYMGLEGVLGRIQSKNFVAFECAKINPCQLSSSPPRAVELFMFTEGVMQLSELPHSWRHLEALPSA